MKQAFDAGLKFGLSVIILSSLNSCVKFYEESSLEKLVIITGAGQEISYQVERADTDHQRRKGLMFRRHMSINHGMLLVYDAPQKVNIWMKNTYIPLDIIYIDANGNILKITRNTKPLSTDTLPSDADVLAVLELNSGQVTEQNISVGDRVLHDVFNS